jgi:hypothetical protein
MDMFQRTSPVLKTFVFLALLSALVVAGACGSASTDAADTQASIGGEDARFSPWEKTLALSSPFPICSGASAFKPSLEGFEGRTLSFQIHGIAKGTFSIYDYQTQTVWSPFTGRTFEGKLHPSRMDRVPLVLEPWEDWVERYPETDVVFASRKFEEREHGRGEHNQIGAEYLPDGFKDVANMDDTRLNANVLIFGVTNLAGDQSIAFPLDFLEGQEVMTYEFANESYLLKKINEFTVVSPMSLICSRRLMNLR